MKNIRFFTRFLVLFLCVFALAGCQKKNDSTPADGSSDSLQVQTTEQKQQESSSSEIKRYGVSISLTEVDVPDKNIIGENGYFERQNKILSKSIASIAKEETDKLGLQPVDGMTLATGHTVYSKGSTYYIISGNDAVKLSGETLVQSDLDTIHILREEERGERILPFWDDESYDAAVSSWNGGVSILTGETEAPEDGCIILNGCLLDVKPDFREFDVLYLPVRQIAEAYSEYSGLKGSNKLRYYLSVAQDSEDIKIPCKTSYALSTEFSMSEFYDTWIYRQNGSLGIMLTMPTPEEYDHFYMSASDVSQILGWQVFVSDDKKVISIETDPLDVSNRFVNMNAQAQATESQPELSAEEITQEEVEPSESKITGLGIAKRIGTIFIGFLIFAGFAYAIVYFVRSREH